MTRRNRIVLCSAAMGLAVALGYAIRAAASGIPSTSALSYAGVLEDANGPITGSHNIQVILYDAATAGNNLCQSTSAALGIAEGHFSVQLPDACTTAVGANPNVWADVLVDGSDTGRTKIGAVPYAIEANHAVNADKATTATTAAAATTATNAGHANTADTATTATSASSLSSTGASGGLEMFSVVTTSGETTLPSPCLIANPTVGSVVDCTCPSGTYVVSGGGYAVASSGAFLMESRPTSTTTWRTTCGMGTSEVLCGAYYLLCSRLGP
jgi:hypothetical protein